MGETEEKKGADSLWIHRMMAGDPKEISA